MKKIIIILGTILITTGCCNDPDDYITGCGIVLKKGKIGNTFTIEVKDNITDYVYQFQITNARNNYLEVGSKYCW